MPRIPSLSQRSSIPLLPVSTRDPTSTPDTASTSDTIFSENSFNKIEKDDNIWKDYVDAARKYDERMVDEWNKFLDVILVFVSASLLWFIS